MRHDLGDSNIEKIEFQSPESKIQDSKILRRSFRVILESRIRRLKFNLKD